MVNQVYFNLFEEEGVWMVHAAAAAENPGGVCIVNVRPGANLFE